MLAGKKDSTRTGRWSKLVPGLPLQSTYLSVGRLSFAIHIYFRFHLCYFGGRVCQIFQIDTIKMKDEEDTCFGQMFTRCTRKSCPGYFRRNQRKPTFKKYIFLSQRSPTFYGCCSCTLLQVSLLQPIVGEDDFQVKGFKVPGRARGTHSLQFALACITPGYFLTQM